MRAFTFFTRALLGLASLSTTFAANSFAGSNLYYAAGLTDNEQVTLLEGLESAGVKVLRVWLDGKSLVTSHPFQCTFSLYRSIWNRKRDSNRLLPQSSGRRTYTIC